MAEIDDERVPGARRRGAAPAPRIHRAGERVPLAPTDPPVLPLIDELAAPSGRAVLERLIRKKGAVASLLVPVLAAGWRRGDGSPPGDAELRALLDAHGLLRPFQRRERDAALHALRAAGGVKRRAAAALALAPGAFDELLARTGAAADAEAVRDRRRAELRRRATLAERARLLLEEAEALDDLGLTEELEADLRRRMPDHLAALRAGGGPSLAGLSRSLGLPPSGVAALARRLGLEPPAVPSPAGPSARPRRPRAAPGRPSGRPSGRPAGFPAARPASGRGPGGRRPLPRRPGQRHRPPL